MFSIKLTILTEDSIIYYFIIEYRHISKKPDRVKSHELENINLVSSLIGLSYHACLAFAVKKKQCGI